MISWCMSRWGLMLQCTIRTLPYWSRWSPSLTPTDKLLLCYEVLLDNIVQGLRHKDPNLCMHVIIKAKHKPIDLEFLYVKV